MQLDKPMTKKPDREKKPRGKKKPAPRRAISR
jgi:hypothetical protein